MKDHDVHGLVQSREPMTHCGKATFGLTTTTELGKVTCLKCLSVIEKVRVGGDNNENIKRKRVTYKARY